MMTKNSIRTSEGTWTLRAGGAVLAETHNALEVAEHNRPTQIYFPQENIAMAFLEPSVHTILCNDKGTVH